MTSEPAKVFGPIIDRILSHRSRKVQDLAPKVARLKQKLAAFHPLPPPGEFSNIRFNPSGFPISETPEEKVTK